MSMKTSLSPVLNGKQSCDRSCVLHVNALVSWLYDDDDDEEKDFLSEMS